MVYRIVYEWTYKLFSEMEGGGGGGYKLFSKKNQR